MHSVLNSVDLGLGTKAKLKVVLGWVPRVCASWALSGFRPDYLSGLPGHSQGLVGEAHGLQRRKAPGNAAFLFCIATWNYGPHTGKDHRKLPGLSQSPQSPFLPLPEEKPWSFNKSLLQEAKIRINPEESARELGNESHPYPCLPWPFLLPASVLLLNLTNQWLFCNSSVCHEGRALPDILPLTLSIALLNQEDGDNPVRQWAPPSQPWRADQFLARMGILCPLIQGSVGVSGSGRISSSILVLIPLNVVFSLLILCVRKRSL